LVGDYILNRPKKSHDLIPKSLKTQLYKAIRDSFASEHGARMTAMHKATDNATDLKNVEIDLQKHVKLR
jgi:F-type H+-transporting ATPase subunit gamma